MKQIIATGNLHQGFSHIGPFNDLPEALRFAEDHLRHAWTVLNLLDPADWETAKTGEPQDG